jgi:hypothetical protein
VSGVERNGEGFTVQTEAGPIEAASVIIATGGLSWSSLGTTGDGLAFASFLRHKVTPAVPALAPIYFTSPPSNELAGVSLRSVTLMAEAGNEKVERRGDLLFTHRGISGPASLSISRPAAELFRSQGAMEMFIDFFPEHSPEQLSKIFAKKASGNGRQMIRKFLQQCALAPPADDFEQKPFGTIPNVLVPLIMSKAGIDRDQQWSVMTKKQRPALVSVLKKFRIGSVRKIPLDQAEVSAGGVSLREVDSKSMESRLNRHLFFCGEVLDYAGEVGGFNLQAAFSTGWAAGSSAAASLLQ